MYDLKYIGTKYRYLKTMEEKSSKTKRYKILQKYYRNIIFVLHFLISIDIFFDYGYKILI